MQTRIGRRVKSYFISYYGITETVIRFSKHLSSEIISRGGANYMTILSSEDEFISLSFSKSGRFGLNPSLKTKIYNLSYVKSDNTFRLKSKDVLDFSISTNSSNCKDTARWYVTDISVGNYGNINVYLKRQA